MKSIIYTIMEWIAGIALIIASIVVVMNILLGKLTGVPFTGTYEIIGLCCSVMASMAIPMATLTGNHVAMDIVVRMMGRKGQIVFDYISNVIQALVGLVLAYASYRFSMKMYTAHETTDLLSIPIWPFRFVWMLGCLLIFTFSVYNMLCIPRKYQGSTMSSADLEIAEARREAENIYGMKDNDGGDSE